MSSPLPSPSGVVSPTDSDAGSSVGLLGGVSPVLSPTASTATPPAVPTLGGGGAFKNRVHPSPTGGSASPPHTLPPLPERTAARRSSVLTGAPDLEAPRPRGPSGAPREGNENEEEDEEEETDEEEEEDSALGASAFHRQRSLTSHAASSHRLELLIATFNVCIHFGTLITDLILIADYADLSQSEALAGIIVCRIIVGLVEIEFDYLNRGWDNGRWKLVPIIFLNLRVLIDFPGYLKSWKAHRGRQWANSDFRATASFETFIGCLPSMIVQIYIMINPDTPSISSKWIVALLMTCLSASIDLLFHFRYVHVHPNIYVAQFLKALISTTLRTLLVAELLLIIRAYVMLWMVLSFGCGLGLYYVAWFIARKNDRDDPFEYGAKVLHGSFGGLVAATMLFVSIPFAPSHSAYDWWLGYLLGEAKMAVENFIMLAIVLNSIHSDYRDDLFYSVLGMTLVLYIGNLCACVFIHLHVRKELTYRDIYSNTSIVKLFAHYGQYYRERWHPDSMEKHGSAQTHLIYRNASGKGVHEAYQQAHDMALRQSVSINASKLALARQQSLNGSVTTPGGGVGGGGSIAGSPVSPDAPNDTASPTNNTTITVGTAAAPDNV